MGTFRLICLLDGIGKALERVILTRILSHLEDNRGGENLYHMQYGFRAGCSTIDALLALRSLIEEITAEGRFCLLISLDIRNAFNSPSCRDYGSADYPPIPIVPAENYSGLPVGKILFLLSR